MKTTYTLLFTFFIALILSGCSLEFGQRVTNSHYVYPNSNVTPLGPTDAKINKFGILFPSQVKKDDYHELFNEALARHQGANVVLNMGLDVKYTNLLNLFWFTKFTLTGTAAKMEVGEQELSQVKEKAIDDLIEEQKTKDSFEN